MAENESLDVNLSKRWLTVLHAILQGRDPGEVSGRILKALQRAWQKTQRQLLKHGTSLQALIDATLDQRDLDPVFRQTKRHDYVKLFELEQRSFDTPEQLLERVVSASLHRVLDQYRDRLLGTEACPNIGAWMQLRNAWLRPIGGEIERFAHRLASRPSAPVRVAALPEVGDPAAAASFISLSLLNQVQIPVGARQ